MSGAAAALSGFLVFLLSVSVIQGQDDLGVTYTSSEICALKGSTVEIRCSYRYPSRVRDRDTTVEETFWFSKLNGNEPVDLRTHSEYAGRVQHSCHEKSCTLRITDLRESDSAEYKFRFITNQPDGGYIGSPGVTLSVTDIQVQTSSSKPCKIFTCTNSELRCHTSCHLPGQTSYIWYKNGEEIHAKTSSSYSDSFYPADRFSCAVKGHEKFPSPPVCGHGRSCNRVTYADRSICAFKGSSVNISCTYDSNGDIRSKFWFSPERSRHWWYPLQPEDLSEDSQYRGRVRLFETEKGRSTLRITDLRQSDSVEYHFKFTAESFYRSRSLPGTTLTVTDKDGNRELEPVNACSKMTLPKSCTFSLSAPITADCIESKIFEVFHHLNSFVKDADPDLQVQVIRSSTGPKLICHSSCLTDRSPFVWYKNDMKIKEEASPSYTGDVDPAYSYSCAYESYRSSPAYAPVVPLVLASPPGDIMKDSSVSLTCSSNANPAAKYTWYKRNVNLTLHVRSKEPQLIFISIQSSDSGEYYCTAENKLGKMTSKSVFVDVKYGPKTSTLSVNSSAEIVEGSSVTLTCSSDANPAANYTWYKENQTLLQGPEDTYHFTSISSEDSGLYHCKAENQYRQINSSSLCIDVQYAPKLPSVSVSPSAEIVEGSSVTLTCSSDANPAANYTWYKEDEDSPKASGQMFTITDFRAEHSGNYYCEAHNRIGRHNSTLHLIVAAGVWKSAATGTITAVLLVIILLAVLMWIRRKKSIRKQLMGGERADNREQLNMDPVYDNLSAAAQRQPAEQQDDLHYASVSFSQNQADDVYSNIRPAQPRWQIEEEDEEGDVDYASIKIDSASSAPGTRCQDDGGDSFALYSIVNKNRVNAT